MHLTETNVEEHRGFSAFPQLTKIPIFIFKIKA